ncbi:hypothetical protein MmTuc01_0410 [Methanosarcina mazei Tuc01]|uniref:Uncharacterized protein n=1 Tax=Methanosarcina mazei Tuc01 TaxID=1236903 RepID=M1Q0Q3_METMZ|nr:hypothetical protein MmTuc01_0410 [Methanosarcina mazei Tuc01]
MEFMCTGNTSKLHKQSYSKSSDKILPVPSPAEWAFPISTLTKTPLSRSPKPS